MKEKKFSIKEADKPSISTSSDHVDEDASSPNPIQLPESIASGHGILEPSGLSFLAPYI